MTTDGLPSVLNDDNFAEAEPSEQTPPPVSLSLVEHLRMLNPVTVSPLNMTAHEVVQDQAFQAGKQMVIDYLANLVQQQNGDTHVLPGTETENQSTSSRAPGARRRG